MYLKSISMQGFKSFAKKISLDLSTPVTGVVGPNGSGKSNVAEAIRFVLGEQSMKGLRSKSGSDLIFKGSTHLSPLSRASVSIHLDNSEKKVNEKLLDNNHEMSTTLSNFINLDEIILTREIFTDGASEYLINNTKVRLKDVQELLAMANISAAGHTIVNQGEADRILLSNNNERREMIEDALGLRIYHMRIKEGEKKLEKVKTHLNEIDLMRRENIPHLNYLKKQVKELEKREEEINNTSKMLEIYLYKENLDIEKKKGEVHHDGIEGRIETLEKELHTLLQAKKETENKEDTIVENEKEKTKLIGLENEIQSLREKMNSLTATRDSIYKEIVNLDLEIKFLDKKHTELLSKNNINEVKEQIEKYILDKNDLDSFLNDRENLWKNIFSLYEKGAYTELKSDLEKANGEEKSFFNKLTNKKETEEITKEEADKFSLEINRLRTILDQKKGDLSNLDKEISVLMNEKNSKESEAKKVEDEEKERYYKLDNQILQAKLDLEKLYSQKEAIKIKEDNLKTQELNFENLLRDMSALIGTRAFKYKSFNNENISEEDNAIYNLSQYELLKKLERSKIKIEESGIMNAGDVLDEYKTLAERDEFLATEIADLENSRMNLENLILDLKNTLLADFNSGLQKINFNFNNYFNEIFPGGKASLSIEKIVKSAELVEGEEETERESGIEIAVNLPEKKVKDLQMLSGGERALSSIALIFAMSSINHPPFMVLDETDAALDEANARKYGKMIRKLAEKSKLLVITHNRETMNQCDVLYGVTVGAEGCSKLLSIKFDEATEYAK